MPKDGFQEAPTSLHDNLAIGVIETGLADLCHTFGFSPTHLIALLSHILGGMAARTQYHFLHNPEIQNLYVLKGMEHKISEDDVKETVMANFNLEYGNEWRRLTTENEKAEGLVKSKLEDIVKGDKNG